MGREEEWYGKDKGREKGSCCVGKRCGEIPGRGEKNRGERGGREREERDMGEKKVVMWGRVGMGSGREKEEMIKVCARKSERTGSALCLGNLSLSDPKAH